MMISLLTGASNALQSQEKLQSGTEFKLALSQIMANQRYEAEEFIFKAKYDRADKEGRLTLIEERQNKFGSALDEIAAERDELKEFHKNGTVTQEAFTAGMRTLGLKVALSAKAIKEMDDDIAELRKNIEEKYKQKFALLEENHNRLKMRAEGDSSDIEYHENEAKNETSTIEKPAPEFDHNNETRNETQKRGEK